MENFREIMDAAANIGDIREILTLGDAQPLIEMRDYINAMLAEQTSRLETIRSEMRLPTPVQEFVTAPSSPVQPAVFDAP